MKALRKLREQAGLTQFVVARKAGVPRMRLSLAECGQLRLSREEEAAVREAICNGIRQQAAQLHQLLSGKQAKVERQPSQEQSSQQSVGT
jgi:transcriptional regulator with XRE-family HTH domain